MDKQQYLELKEAFAGDLLSLVYNLYKIKGGTLGSDQFVQWFMIWSRGDINGRISEIIRAEDVEHEVVTMVDLKTGKIVRSW